MHMKINLLYIILVFRKYLYILTRYKERINRKSQKDSPNEYFYQNKQMFDETGCIFFIYLFIFACKIIIHPPYIFLLKRFEVDFKIIVTTVFITYRHSMQFRGQFIIKNISVTFIIRNLKNAFSSLLNNNIPLYFH